MTAQTGADTATTPPTAGSSSADAPAHAAGASSVGSAGVVSVAASGGAGVAGMEGPSAQAAGAPSAEPAPTVDASSRQPTLPAVTDPAMPGAFMVERVDAVEGLSSHTLFIPDAVSSNGKHPVVIWTNGNSTSLDFYLSFIEHVASHGFLIIADKDSLGADRQAEVASQIDALDWAFAENARADSRFFGLIDTGRIAVMGHSLGSLASFGGASDERVTTSIHFSGGITDNPVGFDPSWLQKLHNPAAFLCGADDTTAGPSCDKDFELAMVPVFLGKLIGADHIGPFFSEAGGGEYGRAGVAWLRWRLADDDGFASWFVGDTCTLCTGKWDGMQRGLDR